MSRVRRRSAESATGCNAAGNLQKENLKSRFIKIRTIWDDRNVDNNNVSDYVTFTNESVQKMIRIWTLENKRDEEYTYDNNSNRTVITENDNERKYKYYKNSNGGNTARVMYDGKWWYTYDANGNRTARAINGSNNGNKVSIDKNGEYWEYEWDYHNRLTRVLQQNAPDSSTTVCVEYTYDALNRRIERVSRTNSEPETTQYAYGRNGALTYQKKSIANTKSSRTFSYLNDQLIGFIDRTSNESEVLRFVLTDIQGSVTEVYDEECKLLWKSGYTAFGIKAGESTILIDFDGLYIGCDYDAETGLTYHLNRWRSEDGANFISEDFARDGLNWYGYAGQNPITSADWNGLKTIKYSINFMQNYNGNIPHTDILFSQKGCTFATMIGIIDNYREAKGMNSINWNAMLKNSELDNYFVSEQDVKEGKTTGSVGDLKRDKILKDFSDGNLMILADVSGADVSSTIDSAILDNKNVYLAGRAKVDCGSLGKGVHEVGIIGKKDDTRLEFVGSSRRDENREYQLDGNLGKIDRIIIIGEKE